MRRIETIVCEVALLSVALLGMLACKGEPKDSGTAAERTVLVCTPERAGQAAVSSHPGVVREAHEVKMGFKTAGQLTRVLVKEGDHIRQGQLVATLDDADYRLGVEALQVQYDQLREEVGRTRQLFEQHSVSANDYEKAAAGLRQLGVQLQVNKNKLAYTRLYAPVGGVVQAVNFSRGEMVDAGTAVLTVMDLSRLEVVCDLSAEDYRERHTFESFTLHAAGLTQAIPLRLLSLTPKADATQLYQLRLTMEARHQRLLTAGQNVRVEITGARCAGLGAVDSSDGSSDGLLIPLSAVLEREGHTCVWVVGKDRRLSLRRVSLEAELSAEGMAVVRSGLTGSEQVVRAGAKTLRQGERVRLGQDESPTNVGNMI